MKKVYYNKSKRKILNTILLIFMLYLVLFPPTTIQAKPTTGDVGGYQVIYDINQNELLTVDIDAQKGIIYMTGTHHYSGSEYAYLTVGYTMGIKPEIASLGNKRIGKYVEVEREEAEKDVINGDKITSFYKITMGETFILNMFEVWKSSKGIKGEVNSKAWWDFRDELKKGMDVYLSNIFAVIRRGAGNKVIYQSGTYSNLGGAKGTLFYTLAKIRNALPSLGYGFTWSDTTMNYLESYYDIKLNIKVNMYQIDVEFIDTSGKVLMSADEVKKGDFFSIHNKGYLLADGGVKTYLKTDSVKEITVDKAKYKLSKEYNANFISESDKKAKKIQGTSLNDTTLLYQYTGKVPYADCKIQIIFESDTEETPIDIIAVDEDDTIIKNLYEEKEFIYTEPNEKLEIGEVPEYIYDDDGKKYQRIWEKASNLTPTWTLNHYEKDKKEEKIAVKGIRNLMYVNITSKQFDPKRPITIKVYYKQEEEPTPSLPPINPNETTQSRKEEDIVIDYSIPTVSAVIKADTRGNEQFDVKEGIPTTESLYANVLTSEYLLKTTLTTVTGVKKLPITVKRTYYFTWTELVNSIIDDKGTIEQIPIARTETSTITKTVYVYRNYSYTYIKDLAYYKIADSILKNEAFLNGEVTLIPKQYSIPKLLYTSFGKEDNSHIILPTETNQILDLGTYNIYGGVTSSRPSITETETMLTSAANAKVGQIKVKNDTIQFDGITVLDGTVAEQETSSPNISALKEPKEIKKDVLYSNHLKIPVKCPNNNYLSSGTISYTPVISFNHLKLPEQYSIKEINSVLVHTPIYCSAMIEQDNSQYVQLLEPELDCIPLVLDENQTTSDFYLSINNKGYHSEKKGYQTKDYKKYLAVNESGEKLNQVKFPFDIFIDKENDENILNDVRLPANTWYTLDTLKQRMYLPLYINEGTYTIEFRSIANNAEDQLQAVQMNKNEEKEYYVAIDTKKVQVSGRLYGLTIYDVSDYPLWQEIFRNTSMQLKCNNIQGNKFFPNGVRNNTKYDKTYIYNYTVGNKDRYGNTIRNDKYTIPLINGSHPKYLNQGMYKSGYTMRFSLETIGSVMAQKSAFVNIEPEFFWVDEQGKDRKKADVFYKETIDNKKQLIKIGSQTDNNRQKLQIVGASNLGIPEQELIASADYYKIDTIQWKNQNAENYSYGSIHAKLPFRTCSNLIYENQLQSSNIQIKDIPITKEELRNRKQSYYFNYSLPAELYITTYGYPVAEYAKENGLNYKEKFWMKDGYLIVNFKITAINEEGKEYLSYINTKNNQEYSHCSMWQMEGALSQKQNDNGITFSFQAGDTIILPVKLGAADDYQTGGIY